VLTKRLNYALLPLCAALSIATGQPQSPDESLKRFLLAYLKGPGFPDDKTTRFTAASADLNDDGKAELIIYITGRSWCGSGGCNLLILTPKDSTYAVVGELSITRPPIRMLTAKSNGWHDISVWVQGGGIRPGREAKLSFDGKTYPSNPSVPPAAPLTRKVAGKILISGAAKGSPLY